jgi:hypothetical protein
MACGGGSGNGGSTAFGGSGGHGNGSATGGGGDLVVFTDAGDTDALSGCDPQTFVLQQAPPSEVYLVLDRSGSMSEPGANPGVTRWQEVKTAVSGAVTTYGGSVHFGLLMYPEGSDCSVSGPQVKFDKDTKEAIDTALSSKEPAGGTPTTAALNNAADSLTALGTPGTAKFLVVATDGGPNCNNKLTAASGACTCSYAQDPLYCCTNAPDACYFGRDCLDDQRTIDTITSLRSSGIDTFVIGLAGTSQYAPLLNAMATAGGHPQQGAATQYYVASDPVQLAAALQTIAISVISCVIQLGTAPDKPDGVSVYVDGQEVPQDKSLNNGWGYTDPTLTAIQLFGSYCDQLKDGKEHSLTATFACSIN